MQFWFLFAWVAGLTALFVGGLIWTPAITPKRTVLATALIAAIARTVPILVYPDAEGLFSTDVMHMEQTADAVLHGRNVYREGTLVHPYPPFHMYTLAAMKAIANATNTSFFVWMRLPQASADVGISTLLVLSTRAFGGDERAAWRNGFLYAVCPFAVVVATLHGQFDAISVFLCLAAILFLLGKPHQAYATSLSATAMALGILQKLWPTFLLPLFVARLEGWSERLRFCAFSAGILGAALIVHGVAFGSTPHDIYTRVLRYQAPLADSAGILLVMSHLPDLAGRSAVMAWWTAHGEWPAAVAILTITFLMIWQRRDILLSIIAILCALFVFLPDGGWYHYSWIIPFGLLARHYIPVTVLVVAMTGRYVAIGLLGVGLFFPSRLEGAGPDWTLNHEWILGVIAWLTFLGWGAWIFLRRTSPTDSSHTFQSARSPTMR